MENSNIFIKIGIFTTVVIGTLSYNPVINIGVILKQGDEIPETIVRYVLWKQQRMVSDGVPQISVEVVTETAEKDDVIYYHQAVCRLMRRGISALIAPTESPYSSILIAYSNEFHLPLISPALPEVPPDLSTQYAIGMRQSTTRAMLDLIRHYKWENIVYFYDHDYGPEKLHLMFSLGYRVLNLHLVGMLRVTSDEDANNYLQKLDIPGKHRSIHVILDTDSSLARDIILRHVHDIRVRKKNFHFLLSQPTLPEFWASQRAEFGALNVTGFLALHADLPKAKVFEEEWMQLSPIVWPGAGSELNVSHYYYYDATLVLMQAVRRMSKSDLYHQERRPDKSESSESRDCLQNPPIPQVTGAKLAQQLRWISIKDGVTGRIQFDSMTEQRKAFDITIVESTSNGNQVFGSWSEGSLRIAKFPRANFSEALPQINDKRKLQVTTIISPPFMMYKKGENSSHLKGNDRFEGYCKDMLDLIAKELDFEYELKLVEDGLYGRFDGSEGRWKGMIGEIIQGKADLAVGDLTVTGRRQRVVDFTDPYDAVGLSLVMKHPHAISATSSIFFILNAFAPDLWICIVIALILFIILFHFITKFTGAPDSIESVSGIWGRKHRFVLNVWFAFGSSVMQGTGVYPRSMASRILSSIWWFSTLIFTCLFIASLTAQRQVDSAAGERSPQLEQLRALSMETVISESLSRGWPKVGLMYPSMSSLFIQKSILPTFLKLADFIEDNPGLKVASREEGIKRVRQSKANYMFMMDSLSSEYAVRQEPCDLIATHDSYYYSGYGFATRLGSPLKSKINSALADIQNRGTLGHLYRKWWMDTNKCNNMNKNAALHGTLHSFSGLLCMMAAGFLILFIVFGVQYMRRIQVRENRRQQLSFEDMNLGHTLPLPPPELLEESHPTLNLPDHDQDHLL